MLLLDLIDSFDGDAKTPQKKYEQFLLYVYFTFDKKIKSVKTEKLRNKYIKIRKNILEYIVSHKKEIIKSIK